MKTFKKFLAIHALCYFVAVGTPCLAGTFFNMKLIKITRGQFAQVDDEDFEYLNQFKWQALKSKTTWYAQRSTSRKLGPRNTIMMHREIIGITDKSLEVDHEDHNGLNNQKNNLRKCTHAENCRNTSSNRDASSKYLGVFWNTTTNSWHAAIKSKILGKFPNEIAAAEAYDKKAKEMYGEFANLNFK